MRAGSLVLGALISLHVPPATAPHSFAISTRAVSSMPSTAGDRSDDRTPKRACSRLREVLRRGQEIVLKSRILRQEQGSKCSNQSSPCSKKLPVSGSCDAVSLPWRCNAGSVTCRTLRTIIDDDQQTTRRADCSTNENCNYPQGMCSKGRCMCVQTVSGKTFGGRHCMVRNHTMQVAEGKYSEKVFSKHYSSIDLDLGQRSEMANSGTGSTLFGTRGIRAVLPTLIRLLGVRSILDTPCGDFSYMRHVLASPLLAGFNLSYVGVDIVLPLIVKLRQRFASSGRINFVHLDFMKQALWPADLLIVRDVLFHFDPRRVLKALKIFDRSGAKYLLTTMFPRRRNAISLKSFKAGHGFSSFYSINLLDEPFNLPPPLLAIGYDGDRAEIDRVVGLWRLPLWPD